MSVGLWVPGGRDLALPPSCDGCRYCPLTYPSQGVVGTEAIGRIPVADFVWRAACSRGHEVRVCWVWDGPLEDVKTIHLYRSVLWLNCPDRDVKYAGLRRSRYSREWVI